MRQVFLFIRNRSFFLSLTKPSLFYLSSAFQFCMTKMLAGNSLSLSFFQFQRFPVCQASSMQCFPNRFGPSVLATLSIDILFEDSGSCRLEIARLNKLTSVSSRGMSNLWTSRCHGHETPISFGQHSQMASDDESCNPRRPGESQVDQPCWVCHI